MSRSPPSSTSSSTSANTSPNLTLTVGNNPTASPHRDSANHFNLANSIDSLPPRGVVTLDPLRQSPSTGIAGLVNGVIGSGIVGGMRNNGLMGGHGVVHGSQLHSTHMNAQNASSAPSNQNNVNGSNAQKSGQLKEVLDLADTQNRMGSAVDIAARLEQKRVQHALEMEKQKRAFEQQMRALQAKQQAEERELLLAHHSHSTPPSPPSIYHQRAALTSSNSVTSGLGASGQLGRKPGDLFAPDDDLASKSLPGTRRHSGELDREEVLKGMEAANQRKKPELNGNLVPRQLQVKSGTDGHLLNSFIFDDDIDSELQTYGGKYLQMNTDDDKFPILVRRDSYPGMLSASSAALDLAPLSQTPPRAGVRAPQRSGTSEWPSAYSAEDNANQNILQSRTQPSDQSALSRSNITSSPSTNRDINRLEASPERSVRILAQAGHLGGPPRSMTTGNLGLNLHNGANSQRASPVAERSGLVGEDKRQNSLPLGVNPAVNKGIPSLSGSSSTFDAVADQFSNFSIEGSPGSRFTSYSMDPNTNSGFGYDPYGKQNIYGIPKSPRREMETNRFAGLRLEDLQGDMYALCKDQFGCRYLQKKLEEGNAEHRDMIFQEIYPHFGELMTDSFGNYLSQKLFEFASDDQRDALLESISGELVSIALNMHGTRAVQKIIDHLSTQRQVQSLIAALNLNVVTLIRDLNGNHVIQKCLNHLPPEDNQFIYNAVAANCIEVATHRHGCCVLQRCIDHATESQRIQLITEITYNSLTLVQDPFGNYTVQYCLDLADARFTEAIVRQFLGNICALSAQKFSSNVVEKCIRVADPVGRRAIIDEILADNRVERLLRDSFGNYVCQTALDYADPAQRAALINQIRPILPQIRNTPYGKRIQSKIARESNEHINRGSGGFHHGLIGGNQFGIPTIGLGALSQAPIHQFVPSHHLSNSIDGYTRSPYMVGSHQHNPSISTMPGFLNNFSGIGVNGLEYQNATNYQLY